MTPAPHRLLKMLAIYFVGTLLAVVISCRLLSTSEHVVAVFGRWDVVACGCFAALPAALLIANLSGRLARWQQLMIASGCVVLALLVSMVTFAVTSVPATSVAMLGFGRGTISLAIMTAVTLGVAACSRVDVPLPPGNPWISGLLLIALGFLIPAAYADSVADGLRRDVERLLKARRFLLAERQTRRLTQVSPGVWIGDQPVVMLQPELQQIVAKLNAQIRQPISADASFAELGARITALMHLDENSAALRLLQPLTQGARFDPLSLDYRGLCYQRLEQFSLSLDAYQRAVQYWQAQPPSDARQASLASAWKGIGFAARGLSRRTLEEHAYRELVHTAPTGENHLLLAQSYHEHQKTQLALQHAEIAVQLNPELEQRSDSIIHAMSSEHFGCWQVPMR